MSWPQIGALLSFCLAVLALLLLAIAPVGWRAGWWHFRFAFAWLMTSSGFAAAAAAIVSLLVLLFGGSHLEAGSLAMAAAALVVGAVLVYIPWQYNRLRNTVPRIHDITTDVENPPEFAAVTAGARRRERGNGGLRGGGAGKIAKGRLSRTWHPSNWPYPRQGPSIWRLPWHGRCRAGASSPPILPPAASRPVRRADGSASPTTSPSGVSGHVAREAASTCARSVARGAATSASTPHASAHT